MTSCDQWQLEYQNAVKFPYYGVDWEAHVTTGMKLDLILLRRLGTTICNAT